MNKIFYQFFLFLSGSFVCLYLAFSPTVNIPYINHDSIRYFHKFYNHDDGSQTSPLYGFLKNDGRVVSAELEEMLYKSVNDLSDVSRLRLFTILILAFCAAMIAMAAQSAGMGAIPAFCLTTAMFTLPGFQDIIFVPYPSLGIAIFLSLLAYFALINKWIGPVRFIFTFILLEAVFLLYPPATFFFLMPAMFWVIFHDNWQASRKTCLRDIGVWFLAAAIYYVTLKVFFYAQIKASGHEIAFAWKDIWLYITTFLSQGMPQTFNLWNVYYSKTLGVCLMLFLALLIGVHFFVTKKIGFKRLLALAVIFCIFNLVWFLFGGYMPRQFIASQALILTLFYCCGEWFFRSRIWPVFFICVGLIIANLMITSNVLNNYSELMFVRSRLAQFVNSSTREIHIIRQKDPTRGYNGLPIVYDNINSPTGYYEFPDLIRVALKELPNPFELHCIVTYSNYGETFALLPNSVVIDMNDLVYISSRH